MRILVVDDEPSLLLTLTANLELEGFEVVGAENAEQAIAAVADGSFDLVLSDIRMPGMNGVDLFREIRKLKPALPVVLMTGFALEGLVQAAMKEGAYTVLPKNCSIDLVLEVLNRAASMPMVLVVDDLAECAETLAAALVVCGIRAHAVVDAATALALVKQGDVDVCVIDMSMPDVDGAELMKRVRLVNNSVAFIAISGVSSELLRAAGNLGAFACLQKPIAPEELAQVVARARGSAMRASS